MRYRITIDNGFLEFETQDGKVQRSLPGADAGMQWMASQDMDLITQWCANRRQMIEVQDGSGAWRPVCRQSGDGEILRIDL